MAVYLLVCLRFSLWLYLICKDSGTKEQGTTIVFMDLARLTPLALRGITGVRTDRSASLSSTAILIWQERIDPTDRARRNGRSVVVVVVLRLLLVTGVTDMNFHIFPNARTQPISALYLWNLNAFAGRSVRWCIQWQLDCSTCRFF